MPQAVTQSRPRRESQDGDNDSMKFFLDTANINEIRAGAELGIVDGVTTNPSLVAKEGMDFRTLVAKICEIISGPVSAEGAVRQVRRDGQGGPRAGQDLRERRGEAADDSRGREGAEDPGRRRHHQTNLTLIFQPLQALIVAKTGATFCSPFLGRLDDISQDGMPLIDDIRLIYDNYGFRTEILAASLRHPLHVVQAARAGADIGTMPYKVFQQMLNHPLTDIGLEKFLADYKKALG